MSPAPAMVNAVNTPIAYSATSLSTLAPVTSSSASETTVSAMIPLENASRCPRRVSTRGRKRSSATKLARNGKPVKGVLAPV